MLQLFVVYSVVLQVVLVVAGRVLDLLERGFSVVEEFIHLTRILDVFGRAVASFW